MPSGAVLRPRPQADPLAGRSSHLLSTGRTMYLAEIVDKLPAEAPEKRVARDNLHEASTAEHFGPLA